MRRKKYQVELKRKAVKSIKRLPLRQRRRIYQALLHLTLDPLSGKKLEGELAGLYSLPIWPYRIIYEIYRQKLVVLVVDIAHRQGAY